MTRIGRLHIPGGYYHVMGRGLERRYIFDSRVDKLDFLDHFGDRLTQTDFRCLAWTLMSNHYHFLLQVGHEQLGKLMAPVLGGFAGYYNRRHGRCGYVFQNRFKSILVEKDSYLLELVRYIHSNPLAAGLISSIRELKSYPWTGHTGMLNRQRQSWHNEEAALENFGATPGRARVEYLKFMQLTESKPCASLGGGGLVRSHGGWESLER